MRTPFADHSRDRLVDDLRSVIQDAEELLQLTAGHAGEQVSDLRSRMDRRLAVAKSRLGEVEAAVVDTSRKAARVTDEYVHEHPWQSLGVVAAAALLVGLLASRR